MSAEGICDGLEPVLRIVGIVVWGIKVVVPIILIVIGMVDLAKAVTEKSEDKIKEAQQKLVKRVIAGVLVFLVVSIIGLVMTIVGSNEYETCMDCINSPWNCSAKQE